MAELFQSVSASDILVEDVKVILQQLGNQNLYANINCVILQSFPCLASTDLKHHKCILLRKRLETICLMLKVKCKLQEEDSSVLSSNSHVSLEEDIAKSCLKALGAIDVKDECISVFFDILSLSLSLLDDGTLQKSITTIVEHCKHKLSCFIEGADANHDDSCCLTCDVVEPTISLRMLESVLSVLLARKNNTDCKNTVNEMHVHCLKLLNDEDMNSVVVKLVCCSDDVLIAQVLLCVIPKLVAYTRSTFVLQELWNNISVQVHFAEKNVKSSVSHAFVSLCVLADFYLPCSGQNLNVSFTITQDNSFWNMILLGLAYEDPVVRKQALYLLKRAVDEKNKCDGIMLPSASLKESLFYWNPSVSEELNKIWNDVFLILEVLEEKQLHLVKPVLSMIDKVIEACCKSLLDISWILCIFDRILKHDNNSVVKWGVVHLINLDASFYARFSDNNILHFITSLMNALNNSFLYARSGDLTSLSEVGESLKNLFVSITDLPSSYHRLFFTNLLYVLCKISWGPVPLFHVVAALSSVTNIDVWDRDAIYTLRSFIMDALGTQIVYIRGAIQCFIMKILILLSDVKQLDLIAVADILGSFRRKEAMKRGTGTWKAAVTWLKTFVSEADAYKYMTESIISVVEGKNMENEKQSVARMMILLCDAHLISLNLNQPNPMYSVAPTVKMLLDCFQDCDKRFYISANKQDRCLEILIHLLEESNWDSSDCCTKMSVLSLICNALPGIFTCLKQRMCYIVNLQAFHSVTLFMNSLEAISREHYLFPVIFKHIEMLQENALHNIQLEFDKISPLSIYFNTRVLAWISNFILMCNSSTSDERYCCSNMVWQKQKTFVERMCTNRKLNEILVKRPEDEKLTRDLQTLWGKLVSGHLQAMWSMFSAHLHLSVILDSQISVHVDANILLDEAMQSLEIGGRGMLLPVMSAMQVLMPRHMKSESLDFTLRFISLCWKGIFEHRKTELFWMTMEKFVQMLFQKCVVMESVMQEHLIEYGKQIFSYGQSVSGLCNILMTQLQQITGDGDLNLLEPFIEILIEALIFGPVHRRDQRVDNDTCMYITSLEGNCSVNELVPNDCGADGEVRARAFQLLLELVMRPQYQHMIAVVAEELSRRYQELSLRKSRYYGDSHIHRIKHRMMQALLLVEPALSSENREQLRVFLIESLLTENHQPSVRYQQEWLLVRILSRNKQVLSDMWEILHQASEKRPGSMCSFIAVAFHVACILLEAEEQEAFLDRSMQEILPWCMAQHFNVRLYAQVVLQKLWDFSKQQNMNKILEKYAIVQSCLKISLERGSSIKNVQKLIEDFYFSAFHPIKHFTLETIFYELPRLANVTYEEWLPANMLESCGIVKTPVPIYNSDSHLKDYDVATWVLKNTGGIAEDEDVNSKEIQSNVQKKIIPWKSMTPDHELLLSMSELLVKRKQATAEGGLIVVASLIDRPPNLGGLSRTCEVFGVSEYVLGSLKYVEDKQFQSLSVSAERWIPISEVKPHTLSRYLGTMKKSGYTVMGAEQTANSTKLHEISFPKKTLLLLGNEKEGIPADLLPLLDVCVEIPQQGIVRSLNVHVTGAIFIWEYSRQHLK